MPRRCLQWTHRACRHYLKDGAKLFIVQRRFTLWIIRTDSTFHPTTTAPRLVATTCILIVFILLILLQSPRSGRTRVPSDARSRYSTKSPVRGSRVFRQRYRPPTPPKPAIHRKDRPEDQPNPNFETRQEARGSQNYVHESSQSEKYRVPTLSTQPSFMTEKSRSTFGTSSMDSGTSTPASRGQSPLVHGVTILPMFIVAKPVAKPAQSRGCFSGIWSRVFRC
ncbi:uncharacterized protein BT62DRAFT_665018 [Guyanagaster necrorhizus]|uniref:Transmembrane protein n=1 Tax=Guyanagaster necrorhizus TaxID=856835 RepID=A0A9P7VX45_9AGAR|nr:uncharacterized protein BT62DRAFT_665018 [Guyanagaster necrorhizus MCA 3950]KAG7449146.1 hypothetical protein BT62DRAFT_665018 [Guyanagaster necrorhizus MCA 3950]